MIGFYTGEVNVIPSKYEYTDVVNLLCVRGIFIDLKSVKYGSIVVFTKPRPNLDILEFATSQLLELRYYDGLFEAQLARVYDHLAAARTRRLSAFSTPYRRLGREMTLRYVEQSEFAERVDNALKVIGDFYLARVYRSAVRRFHIAEWRDSVKGKQQLLAQAYELVRGEIESRRSTVLELVVIFLILLELVMAIYRH